MTEKRYIEEENEWDFYPYKNLRFIWEIDEKNKRSILHIKKKKEEKIMTENKRFIFDDKVDDEVFLKKVIKDTENNNKEYNTTLKGYNDLCNLLNELAEENQQLHRVIEENEKENKELTEEVIGLRHIAENIKRIKSIWGLLSKELEYM